MKKPLPPRWPWSAVDLEPYEVSAIKALSAHAWSALDKLTAVDALEFTAGGEDGRRASDFAGGKRWVGKTLRNIRDMKMPGPSTPPSRSAPPEGE